MKKAKVLTGDYLVAKGITKLDATLPEIGVKDVIPNGSWLEQKQIQAAVEARKHLIAVDRIEKFEKLSQADWDEELQLAIVSQQTGGYWYHLGHHEDKKLCLYPEEALFLMETNNLQLKYNEVTVSLQQAYVLLLRSKIKLLQYKVYASLSRLGYKIFRHDLNKYCKTAQNIEESEEKTEEPTLGQPDESENIVVNEISTRSNDSTEDHTITDNAPINISSEKSVSPKPVFDSFKKELIRQKLIKNQMKTVSRYKINKFFENIPDMYDKKNVTITAPDENYLPRNVFLNETSYTLTLENIRRKLNTRQKDSKTYSLSDNVNNPNIRSIRSSTSNDNPSPTQWHQHTQNRYYPPPFWSYLLRPPINNYQRNWMPHVNFPPRTHFYPRHQMPFMYRPPTMFFNQHINSHFYFARGNRKRTRSSAQKTHFDNLKSIAARLRALISSGNIQNENIQSLQNLIHSYNIRYKTGLRLSSDLELITDENIVATIDLEEDDVPKTKKTRSNIAFYENNIQRVRQMALKLKQLHDENKANPRHRRAFSNMVKQFNKCFNADLYVSDNFEVTDRKHVIIESSESDCVIEEPKDNNSNKIVGKRIINPFSILKQCSIEIPSTSTDVVNEDSEKYNELIKIFGSNWVPNKEDFGRAEIVTKEYACNMFINTRNEEFLFDFIQNYKSEFNTWTEIKLSFWDSLEEATPLVDKEDTQPDAIDSLVKPEDCKDTASILKKLDIIKTQKSIQSDTDLSLDFDVYQRDVQNFKKSCRPIPHFRILCLDEKNPVPPGEAIEVLQSKFDENVPIVFAIVGISSVNYIQMKVTELPVYISTNDTM